MNKSIPKLPGVYIFKDKDNAIIYIGKAKSLVKRVSSYFKRQQDDWKVLELIKEHADIEYIITKNETEALLLEAQLVKKFKPKYNVLLKNGNPFIYILITSEDLPIIKLVPKKKARGTYFGPFLYKQKVRKAFDYLIRKLRLSLCTSKVEGCLEYHLNRCAGNCLKNFNIAEYKLRLDLAQKMLDGKYEDCKIILQEQIKVHNKNLEFEKSQHLSEYLQNLEVIFDILKTGFSENKYIKDVTAITLPLQYKINQPLEALAELQVILNMPTKPKSIDCFDISHFQSNYIVGSCVRFLHGIPDKNNFRRFKIKSIIEQNDYAALQEIVARRYRDPKDLPDIILIDGGKGQLSSIKKLVSNTVCISLAKKEETLFTEQHPINGLKLDIQSNFGKLLIAVRDYAHHFAISYHKLLRSKALKNI